MQNYFYGGPPLQFKNLISANSFRLVSVISLNSTNSLKFISANSLDSEISAYSQNSANSLIWFQLILCYLKLLF